MFCIFFVVVVGQSNYLIDSKPGDILLFPSDIDNVVMHELSEQPATLYGFPKTTPPDKLLFHPVPLTPVIFVLDTSQDDVPHWVGADYG